MKKLVFLLVISFFLISSCKKDDEPKTNYSILSEDDLADITDGATDLSSAVQEQMFSYISVAADSGIFITYPSGSDKKSTLPGMVPKNTAEGWTGPDAEGWYTCHWEGAYDYTQRVRCSDSIVDYEYIISYDGADGSYENINRTEYVKYTQNGKTLYKGYWDWTISNSGYNDISDVHWRMDFKDWNPLNGAGVLDWSWGATSSGGDDVPFYRYLNVTATDAGDQMLAIKITFYDGNTELWSFEYNSPWNPADMPELHSCN
jgi:hypothetical protein